MHVCINLVDISYIISPLPPNLDLNIFIGILLIYTLYIVSFYHLSTMSTHTFLCVLSSKNMLELAPPITHICHHTYVIHLC